MSRAKSYKYVSDWETEFTYAGKEDINTALRLKQGETCKVTGVGNSMVPILNSRQPVICMPVKEDTELSIDNIVLCKVQGKFYLHKITKIERTSDGYLYMMISNNHGYDNGKIPKSQIFGLVIEILEKYNTGKRQQRKKRKGK